jgi:hypothetical protein
MRALFDCAHDYSLERVALLLVKLCFFLRVKFLDLRRAGRLFAQRTPKYDTMMRKLYTVATCLDIVGIVKKTARVSEIQLLVALDPAIMLPPGVAMLVNTSEDMARARVYHERQKEFEAVSNPPVVATGLALPI